MWAWADVPTLDWSLLEVDRECDISFVETVYDALHCCDCSMYVLPNQDNIKDWDRTVYIRMLEYDQFLLCCVDVLSEGIWTVFEELQDPELSRLARALPRTVMQSRADSTKRKYVYAFQRWKSWAADKAEVQVFPIKAAHLALYLQHLSETTQSKAAVEEAVNAANWMHELAGIPIVGAAPIVSVTLNGLRRVLAKPVTKKAPVTPEMLARLCESLGASASLTDVRTASMCLLAFAAFLRFDELVKLRACDIVFEEEQMVVRITSSKTDQYRDGATVPVARSGRLTCPVAMLERYFAMAHISRSDQRYLFRGIVHTKKGERLRESGSISYTRVREIVLKKFEQLGIDTQQLGLHSFRAGGATAAANAGVPDRLFKRHGRWKSESAKDGYIQDSAAERLRVSRSLPI